MFKNNDLEEPNEMIHRFMMPFTRVLTESDKREESNGLIPSSQQQKNSKKKATKFEQQSAYSSKGRMSKVNRKKH
jgi:hypothetical protein